MRFFKWSLLYFFLVQHIVEAQFVYTFENDILVEEDGLLLNQPFSGGGIAPQFSVIDLNFDGTDDLFVFDRASNKVFTYLLKEGEYVYSPFYESFFPQGLKNWVLLRDYNCDGKMDLFTSSIFGMSLYENTSSQDLSWSLKHQIIYTEGFNGQTNLQLNSLDLPAIVDVDGDGDLDILNFNFITGKEVEFHRNKSIENTGACGLDLVRITKQYGDFKECSCDSYAFGLGECPTNGRVEHIGSKTILSFNYLSEDVQDLLIGQEYCDLPALLPNTGTPTDVKLETVFFDFPAMDNSLRMDFPAFYSLDLYSDGVNDLIAAPNNYDANSQKNYQALSYRFKKGADGSYTTVTDKFLKEGMIDVGHRASPLFVDFDFDGDQDLLIGTGATNNGASIWLYENTGTPLVPSFLLRSKDYLNLKTNNYERIKLQLLAVDENEFLDLVLTITNEDKVNSRVFLHTGNPLKPYNVLNYSVLNLPDMSVWDSPFFYRMENKAALFIGKQAGNLEYYISSGNFVTGRWDLISENYLGIEEDFSRRNLNLTVDDVNANGTMDIVLIDGSGRVVVYDNFLEEQNREEIRGENEETKEDFSLNFGNLATITTARLFGNKENSLAIGLLTGGVQLLNNTVLTKDPKPLELKVIAYPNPVSANLVIIQSNKNGKARVFDAAGKLVIKNFEVKSGIPYKLILNVLNGVYYVEVITETKEKKTVRIVIYN